MSVSPIVRLARTRPFTARQRILDIVRAHEGNIFASRHDLGLCKRAAHKLITELGLRQACREMKREFAEVKRDRAIKRRFERWALHGKLVQAEERAARRAERLAACSTGGTPTKAKKKKRKKKRKRAAKSSGVRAG